MKYCAATMLRAADYRVKAIEDSSLMQGRRLDITATHLASDMKVAYDTGVSDPELRGPHGSAAAYALEKTGIYKDGCRASGFTFVPMTFEVFGTWDVQADNELERLSRAVALTRPITATAFYTQWKRCLSLKLISATVDGILLVIDKLALESSQSNRHLVPAIRFMEEALENGYRM